MVVEKRPNYAGNTQCSEGRGLCTRIMASGLPGMMASGLTCHGDQYNQGESLQSSGAIQ